MVHLITRQVSTAVEDLQEVIQTLFNGETKEDSPNILWSLYFNIKEYDNNWGDKTQSNLYFGVGPNSSVDIDYHVIQVSFSFIRYNNVTVYYSINHSRVLHSGQEYFPVYVSR